MSNNLEILTVPNVPYIDEGHIIADVLVESIDGKEFSFQEHDIICIASKAVSISEGRQLSLDEFEPSKLAKEIHEKIPRKDPRAIQAIVEETGAPDGSRLDIRGGYIGGWLPNGLYLTSAGVDKKRSEEVILLPIDADESAKKIGQKILEQTGLQVAIIITDSDGRIDKKGATQVAIGIYGIPPIRKSIFVEETGKPKVIEETVCDMLAASAGLLMGQRGTNVPAVVVRGFNYSFDEKANIKDALNS